jgi:hypothetical protein
MVVFVLLFAIGYIIEGSRKQGPRLDVYTIIVFIVWGTGLTGLILAWWKEGLGGIISSVCFIVFNILAAVSPVPGSSYSFVLLLFMIPSILFLSCWWMERNNKIPST